jgi:pSer/pThr/pTyr-binding forkhead associated (FHA) protein
MATSYRLTMQRGPNVGKNYELVKDVVTMGRDMSNDIVINDAESSRHHARLTKQGVTYVIEDLGSTNGTFVNSARLSIPRPLNPGDTVGMGETITLTYEVITTAPTGATMVGNIDATVVASDLPSAKEMQEMAAASAPVPPPPPPMATPAYEPPTSPMPQPSFDLPSSSSSDSSSAMPSSSDSISAEAKPPANNRNMIIGIVAGVVVLCCCCPTLIVAAYAYTALVVGANSY